MITTRRAFLRAAITGGALAGCCNTQASNGCGRRTMGIDPAEGTDVDCLTLTGLEPIRWHWKLSNWTRYGLRRWESTPPIFTEEMPALGAVNRTPFCGVQPGCLQIERYGGIVWFREFRIPYAPSGVIHIPSYFRRLRFDHMFCGVNQTSQESRRYGRRLIMIGTWIYPTPAELAADQCLPQVYDKNGDRWYPPQT